MEAGFYRNGNCGWARGGASAKHLEAAQGRQGEAVGSANLIAIGADRRRILLPPALEAHTAGARASRMGTFFA